MGLFHIRCKKCNRTWMFCSVGQPSILGEPCNCGSEYHEEYIPKRMEK